MESVYNIYGANTNIQRERSNSIDAGEITLHTKTPEPERPLDKTFFTLFKIKYKPKDTDKLYKCTISQLKELNAPFINLGYKYLSAKLKPDIINRRIMTVSALKIQQWLRSKIMKDNICPVTMTELVYPYFTFKPPQGGPLIYYDLESLANFLVISGEFKDPKTRVVYDVNIVRKIDKLMKSNNKRICTVDGKQFKNLEDALYNRLFYHNKKLKENEILTFDRCLDHATTKLLKHIETSFSYSSLIEKLGTYEFYFRKLKLLSNTYSKTCYNRTLCAILDIKQRNLYKSIGVLEHIFGSIFELDSTMAEPYTYRMLEESMS